MKILSVNAGSSSLKFQLYEMPEEKVLISGVFERTWSDWHLRDSWKSKDRKSGSFRTGRYAD